MIHIIAAWLVLHGSITVSENKDRLDTQGKPEVIVWVKFQSIQF